MNVLRPKRPRSAALLCLMAVLPLGPPARAQVTFISDESEGHPAVVRLTVTPAAATAPVLKHRLFARDIDMKSGNAAPFYYRAQIAFRRGRDASRKEFSEDNELSRWYTFDRDATPLSQLPLERVQRAVDMTIGETVGRELAEAVSRRDCDWQTGIQDIRGPEAITIPLDGFQQNRELSRMLLMKIRLELARGKYDEAIGTMRTNYRLARDTSREPLLVCGLIGVGLANVTNGTLLELIAAPDSPNMYWALTCLPHPLIDMRPAVHFENNFAPRIFPFIQNAATTDRSPEEWNRLYKQTFSDLTRWGASQTRKPSPDADLGATTLALLGYPFAKSKLIELGFDPAEVERMAIGQVMAIYSERICQQFADESETMWHIPYWEMRKRFAELDQRLRNSNVLHGAENREVLPIMQQLLPAMQSAREAHVRLERELAALRVIEALRLYAANHNGKLPEQLDFITEVPIPTNPATGQPFAYRLEGEFGILELPRSDGMRYNRRFEIRIAEKAR